MHMATLCEWTKNAPFRQMIQTGAAALETGAHPAFILSLYHSAGAFVPCTMSAYLPNTLSPWDSDWHQSNPDMGLNIWLTPGYIPTADNPRWKDLYFPAREVESYWSVSEEHIPSWTHSCNHKYNLTFRHLLRAELCPPKIYTLKS